MHRQRRDTNRLKKMLIAALNDEENVLLMMSSPLVFIHLACLTVFLVGFSWVALAVCAVTYSLRVFSLTAGFHRYFSHRAFKTSRFFQFIIAFAGTTAGQLGPLWWAANHRKHHAYADTERDIHSPTIRGFFWAHIGWVLCKSHQKLDKTRIKDFIKFPELMWLERFHVLAPLSLGIGLYVLGALLALWAPGLNTNGWQMVVWGYVISSTLVYHVTFCVNSVSHIFGSRRFKTKDDSKNNLLVALLTGGEGWHNNHHRYPASARQGMYWWEIDATYYGLKVLEKLGIIWDLRCYPAKLLDEADRLKLEKEATPV